MLETGIRLPSLPPISSHFHRFSVISSMRKNAKQFVELKCETCGKIFNRLLKEYKRGQKNKYSIACSRSCVATKRNKEHPNSGNVKYLKANNRQDEFSSFRYYVNKANSKERIRNYGPTNLTVDYLKKVWEAQKGICPYTYKKMEIPKNTQGHHIKGNPIKASLDRIDANKGYIEGNVEFVCLSVNYAKNGFSRDQMMEFFKPMRELTLSFLQHDKIICTV